MHALDAVLKHGNENSINIVEKRVKQLVAKKRVKVVVHLVSKETDFTKAMEFLSKYADKNPSIKKLYTFIVQEKYESLHDEEKSWLQENKSKFFQGFE